MQDVALAVLRRVAEWGARTGWCETEAGRLRYAAKGREGAPPLLLLHGLGDSLAPWAQVAAALARKFRVHLVDLPGHGMSGKPPDWRLPTLARGVARYADRVAEPVLVGHSLGGWIALRLVLSGALRPAGLVLVNPGGALLAREEWAPFRALLSARDRAGALRYLDAAFHRAPLALRVFHGEVLKAMQSEAAQGILDAVEEPDFLREAELASVRVPTRIVWGLRDRLLPAGTFDFFRRALPAAQVVPLDRAGHLPHLEAPRELARAIALPFPRGP